MDPRFQEIQRINKHPLYPNKNLLRKKGEKGYLKYRIMRPLLKVNVKLFRKMHAPSPWMSQTAIKFLDGYLTKEMKGFEFGSGRSSLFFAKRIGKLVSVEHYAPWYKYVKETLSKNQYDHAEIHLLLPDPSKTNDETLDPFIKAQNISYEDYDPTPEYRAYYRKIEEFPKAHFDFVLVDGRARVPCVLNSLPYLKSGGLMIFDNSERDRYRIVFELLKDWEMIQTTTGLSDTTFWIKP